MARKPKSLLARARRLRGKPQEKSLEQIESEKRHWAIMELTIAPLHVQQAALDAAQAARKDILPISNRK
jgi:hypothetical protein